VALVVAENMPKARLKSSKASNSSTMNPIGTWSDSLESYHPYLPPQKEFQKIQKFIAFTVACPTAQNDILTASKL
jgi:hypothetical protein